MVIVVVLAVSCGKMKGLRANIAMILPCRPCWPCGMYFESAIHVRNESSSAPCSFACVDMMPDD